MNVPAPTERSSQAWPPGSWWSAALLLIGLLCVILQISSVQPWLAPAGHGLGITGDPLLVGSGDRESVLPRPPTASARRADAPTVSAVRPGSPADAAGLRIGDRITFVESAATGRRVDLGPDAFADSRRQMRTWREAYWLGTRGDVRIGVAGRDTLTLARPAVWELDSAARWEWLLRHGGRVGMVLLTLGAPFVLLLLRPGDPTAQLIIVTLMLCGVAATGPLRGSEQALGPIAPVLTVFSWMSTSIALPFVSLAIAHFPRPDPFLRERRWLLAVPLVLAAPLLVMSAGTAAYLAGFEGAEGLASWDADHGRVYFATFAAGLSLNVLTAFDAYRRFCRMTDLNERRRIQIATYLLVPGVMAYGAYEGLPVVTSVVTGRRVDLPHGLTFVLQLIAGLPAVGLAYIVAVHRVMSPSVAIRRGVQYALARRTLSVLILLPAVALVVSLYSQRQMSLAQILGGRPLFYTAAIGLLVLGLRYRAQASAWLDRRFFREQYDARRVLLSLAGRVPFETDPQELTALVVRQVEAALHPRAFDVLVAGLEEGRLVGVSPDESRARPLAAEGALATMLRWSEEPLDLDVNDTRSPARRLPPDERAWLAESGTVLLVPMFGGQGQTRTLVGALALGEKRSEEPYTAEDRELLASIAAQVGLALDVARLRQRQAWAHETTGSHPTITPMVVVPLAECPACGRCEDGGTARCPDDGAAMRTAPGLPRVIDAKYRVDRLLGRGGMGAVYRARDVRLDRDVAIKVVRPDLLADSDARTRFRREAQIIAGLQHPSLVAVFDYGTLPDGGAFLVMEFVRGLDLRRVLRAETSLDPDRVVRLLRAVCAGIDTAHAAGVLHRDLKPENIMLPQGGVDAKVLDFGIAKVVGAQRAADHETLTVAGHPIGTPAYMAPEQLAGGDLSIATDVYGLGVIAYEMLTGELPFGRGSLVDIAQRQQKGAPPLDRPERPVAADLQAAVLAALRPSPADRPRSAAAFARSLDAALGGVAARL
jgi:predicted Ser/Thr protein kinase